MTDTTRLASSARQVPLEPGGEVQIVVTASSVRLRGIDADTVTVRSRDGDDLDEEILVESAPGLVIVRDAERGFRIGPLRMRASGAPDLDIDVPRTARVSLKTLSGDVEAAGVQADSRWATASGDMRLVIGAGSHSVE